MYSFDFDVANLHFHSYLASSSLTVVEITQVINFQVQGCKIQILQKKLKRQIVRLN